MNNIFIVGAGKTGRGFLARLAAEHGVRVTFIDKDQALCKRLAEAKSFCVRFFGEAKEAVRVSDYTVMTPESAEIPDGAWIFISVCGQNLKDAASWLATKLKKDKTYHIVTAENCSHPSETVSECLNAPNAFVSEGTVFCTTVEGDGLDILSENYPYFQYDADRLPSGAEPPCPAFTPIHCFGNFLTRKLYTYNAASCVIAYLGYIKGYTDYAAAANDEEILLLLDKNYEQTGKALCLAYGYDAEDQAAFALLSKKKFCDQTIIDTVARNARDPQRKLAAGERIMGPMALIEKYGFDASVLYRTAAAALLYDGEGEKAWRDICSGKTPEQLLEAVCGISANSESGRQILSYYRKYKQGSKKL